MRSYEAARSLFSFLAFCAWSVVVIGIIAVFVGAGTVSTYASDAAVFMAAMPGLGISFIGLFQVAIIQNARATVDTAEYTQQMLKISRDQLNVSKQALQQGDAFQKSYTALNKETIEPPKTTGYAAQDTKPENVIKPSPKPIQKLEKQVQYEGYIIVSNNKTHRVNNAEFRQIEHARDHVDMLCEKDAMMAKIAELSAVAIPQPDPVISQPEAVPEPILLKASALIEQPQELKNGLIEHNGKTIVPSGEKFLFNNIPFSTLNGAKSYIDKFISAPSKPLPGVKRP